MRWICLLMRHYESRSNRKHTWYAHMNIASHIRNRRNVKVKHNQLMDKFGRWYKKYLHVWSAAKLLLWQYDLYWVRFSSIWDGMAHDSNCPKNFSNFFNLAACKILSNYICFWHLWNFIRLTVFSHRHSLKGRTKWISCPRTSYNQKDLVCLYWVSKKVME